MNKLCTDDNQTRRAYPKHQPARRWKGCICLPDTSAKKGMLQDELSYLIYKQRRDQLVKSVSADAGNKSNLKV